jgi:integrase
VSAHSTADRQKLLAAAAEHPPRQRVILQLLLDYQLTPHEICRLTPGDLGPGRLRVRDKRGGVRDVAIDDAATLELMKLSRPGGAQLLAGPSGTLRPDTIRRLVRAAAARAGVTPPPSIHSLARLADARV